MMNLEDLESWSPCWLGDLDENDRPQDPEEGHAKILKIANGQTEWSLKDVQNLYGKISRMEWLWLFDRALRHEKFEFDLPKWAAEGPGCSCGICRRGDIAYPEAKNLRKAIRFMRNLDV